MGQQSDTINQQAKNPQP